MRSAQTLSYCCTEYLKQYQNFNVTRHNFNIIESGWILKVSSGCSFTKVK